MFSLPLRSLEERTCITKTAVLCLQPLLFLFFLTFTTRKMAQHKIIEKQGIEEKKLRKKIISITVRDTAHFISSPSYMFLT